MSSIKLTLDIPLDAGTTPVIKLRLTMPPDLEERSRLLAKGGSTIASLITGNLDAAIFNYLYKSKNLAGKDLLSQIMYWREVFKAMKHAVDPVVCPTQFGRSDMGDDYQ